MKLFLTQETLEDWAVSDRADLLGTQLFVKETRSTHPVDPAVHFVRSVSGDDPKSLVGKVKTLRELVEMGAEHVAASCLIGDAAYEITEGYVTEVTGAAIKSDVPKPLASSPEADLLAAFIGGKS